MRHADQSPPEQIKEPLHLETDDLVFNKNTGDASATGKVEFQTPQAHGSAVGIKYVAKTGTMNLLSAVVMTVNRPQPVHLDADRGVITKQPHQVFLTTVHMSREQQEAWSDQATFFCAKTIRLTTLLPRAMCGARFMAGRHLHPTRKPPARRNPKHPTRKRASVPIAPNCF